MKVILDTNQLGIKTLAVLFVVWLGWCIYSSVSFSARMNKLGKSAVVKPYYLPFGMDTMVETKVLRHQTLEYFQDALVKHGPTFRLYIPGVSIIVTQDPENIKAILATQFEDFGKGPLFHERWEFFIGDGIFAADGEIWSTARALLRPQFKKQRVSDLHVFEGHIGTMISLLPKDGKTVDLLEWWYRFTLDASTEYLFGESVNSLLNPKTSFADAFSRIQKHQSIQGSLGVFWRLYKPKDFIDSMNTLNNFIEPFVERAIYMSSTAKTDLTEDKSEKATFTHSLSEFTQDRKVMRDQLVSTLLAGRDTTACALAWLFYELSYHPEIYTKLRTEVLQTIGKDGKPTYEDLKNMKYLQHCINETLRLYPIVPFNVRTALCDTTLPHGGGPSGLEPIAVAKGTPVNYSALTMQRRADIFGPTVLDFNPDRWNTWIPVPWTYIPFNGGPRICLGQNFALTEMGYATVRMVQRFERVEERSGLPRGGTGFKTDIILSPLRGVMVGLIPAVE